MRPGRGAAPRSGPAPRAGSARSWWPAPGRTPTAAPPRSGRLQSGANSAMLAVTSSSSSEGAHGRASGYCPSVRCDRWPTTEPTCRPKNMGPMAEAHWPSMAAMPPVGSRPGRGPAPRRLRSGAAAPPATGLGHGRPGPGATTRGPGAVQSPRPTGTQVSRRPSGVTGMPVASITFSSATRESCSTWIRWSGSTLDSGVPPVATLRAKARVISQWSGPFEPSMFIRSPSSDWNGFPGSPGSGGAMSPCYGPRPRAPVRRPRRCGQSARAPPWCSWSTPSRTKVTRELGPGRVGVEAGRQFGHRAHPLAVDGHDAVTACEPGLGRRPPGVDRLDHGAASALVAVPERDVVDRHRAPSTPWATDPRDTIWAVTSSDQLGREEDRGPGAPVPTTASKMPTTAPDGVDQGAPEVVGRSAARRPPSRTARRPARCRRRSPADTTVPAYRWVAGTPGGAGTPRPWPRPRTGGRIAGGEVGAPGGRRRCAGRRSGRSGRSRPAPPARRVPSGSTTVIVPGSGDGRLQGHDDAAGLGHDPGPDRSCRVRSHDQGDRRVAGGRRHGRPAGGRRSGDEVGLGGRGAGEGHRGVGVGGARVGGGGHDTPPTTRVTTTQAVSPPITHVPRTRADGPGRGRPATGGVERRPARTDGATGGRRVGPSRASARRRPTSRRRDARRSRRGPLRARSEGYRPRRPKGRRRRPARRRRRRDRRPPRGRRDPSYDVAWPGTSRSTSGPPTPRCSPGAGGSSSRSRR